MHEIWMRSPKSLVYVYLICDCPCTYENGRPNFESMGITLYSQLASDVLASPRSFEDLAAIHSYSQTCCSMLVFSFHGKVKFEIVISNFQTIKYY